ncbi:MAG: family glycosyltransferase [Herminiimonas sp.]|nr:family glycosyltransferase [Herminiimonas sp.]
MTLAPSWQGMPAGPAPAAVIALHARRSAKSITAFASACPGLPVIIVLTGTDLYRDIKTDADSRTSLQLATHLVVLQDAGLQELHPALRRKTSVIYQSAACLKPIVRKFSPRYFDVTMIGHLRDEKDPLTFMRAAAMVASPKVRLTHIGGALDPALGKQAEATQRGYPRYRWLGNLPHATTRQLLKRSHLMVIASKMEGGANVIIEAVTSGVPVLASDISGNRGMLGDDYAGYFPVADSKTLAHLIDRTMTDASFYHALQAQCDMRAPLFRPEREKTALLQLMDNVLNKSGKHT